MTGISADLLSGRRVLLGVTGSISAYKAPEIARLLIKAGAEVRVVMTPAAQRFVGALTFEAITRAPVLTETTESWVGDCNHIGFAKWAEVFAIAPASANTINKLAHGAADNLLLQTALACRAAKAIAPAANTNMIENPITQASIKLLKLNDYAVVEAECGDLACGESGKGRLAEEETIFWQIARALMTREFWRWRGVVITGGGTVEKIDDVRVLSNLSSGKMAVALARAGWLLGGDACLIGAASDATLPIHQIKTESVGELGENLAQALREAKKGVMPPPSLIGQTQGLIKKTPLLLMAAAVSDYAPKNPQIGKLKKSVLGDSWKLELVKTPDLLAATDKSGVFSVGFKAEMDEKAAYENAIEMKKTKKLDAVCLNVLGQNGVSFGSEDTRIRLIGAQEQTIEGDKLTAAIGILSALEKEFS